MTIRLVLGDITSSATVAVLGTALACAALGFADDWTKIDEDTPDTPRYKALGNSMAVPCMRWIGERIQMVDDMLGDEDVQVHG